MMLTAVDRYPVRVEGDLDPGLSRWLLDVGPSEPEAAAPAGSS